jgi:hypothetical protein
MAPEARMTETETREALERLATEIEDLRSRAVELKERIPRSAEEDRIFEGEAEWDPATEMRTVLECVEHDHLGPAAEDLRRAAAWRARAPREELPKEELPA